MQGRFLREGTAGVSAESWGWEPSTKDVLLDPFGRVASSPLGSLSFPSCGVEAGRQVSKGVTAEEAEGAARGVLGGWWGKLYKAV